MGNIKSVQLCLFATAVCGLTNAWGGELSVRTPSSEMPSLTNGSFEVIEPLDGPTLYPTDFGNWQGDPAAIVGATAGVEPLDGNRMLHFLGSTPNGPGQTTGSDMQQNVDLRAIRRAVERGGVQIRALASFNRVAGDAQVDTAFELGIFAYAGHQSTSVVSTVITDSDVATWESASAELELPTSTSHIGIRVTARENVVNDVFDEFAGHFADDVRIWAIVPEPVSTTLLLVTVVGAALFARRN